MGARAALVADKLVGEPAHYRRAGRGSSYNTPRASWAGMRPNQQGSWLGLVAQ